MNARGGTTIADPPTIGPLAPPGPPAAPPTPNAPGVGWGVTDLLVTGARDNLGFVFDVMRGHDPVTRTDHGGDMPWNLDLFNHPSGGGAKITRRDAWTQYLNVCIARITTLEGLLVDNATPIPNDLAAKALATTLKNSLATVNTTPPKGLLVPPLVIPPTWGGLVATAYPLESSKVFTFIQAHLDPVITAYTRGFNIPPDPSITQYRDPNVVRVGVADDAVKGIIKNVNGILAISIVGQQNTFARGSQWLTLWSGFWPFLKSWYDEMMLAGSTSTSGYLRTPVIQSQFQLMGAILIGDPDASATPLPGSISDFLRKWALDPPFPPSAAGLDPTVADITKTNAVHGNGVIRPIQATVAALTDFVAKYAAVRDKWMVNFDTLDATVNTALTRFVTLKPDYEGKRSWTKRGNGFQHKYDLQVAIEQLRNDFNADPTFRQNVAMVPPPPEIPALIGSYRALVAAIQGLVPPSLHIPASTPIIGVPGVPAIVATLKDTKNYGYLRAGLGKAVKALLKAIFEDHGGNGVRTQYRDLRDRTISLLPPNNVGIPLVVPNSNLYVRVADDAEAFAQICLDHSKMPSDALIIRSGAARTSLITSLQALDQEVVRSPALVDAHDASNPGTKLNFSAAIQKVITALAAVPGLTPFVPSPSVGLRGEARPLTESQKLIHYESAPTESVSFTSDTDFVVSAGQKVVLEAKTPEALERMVARLPPKHGPSLVFGLVVDRPGDMTALYKAVAIRLELRLPPEIERKVADRKNAATGWLYDIVQFESGAYYTRPHDYIKPELYAV